MLFVDIIYLIAKYDHTAVLLPNCPIRIDLFGQIRIDAANSNSFGYRLNGIIAHRLQLISLQPLWRHLVSHLMMMS